jgi:hypothetical protein
LRNGKSLNAVRLVLSLSDLLVVFLLMSTTGLADIQGLIQWYRAAEIEGMSLLEYSSKVHGRLSLYATI